MGSPTYVPLAPEPTTEMEAPTAVLRWNKSTGRLQQKWDIRTLGLRTTLSQRFEWRDVPAGDGP